MKLRGMTHSYGDNIDTDRIIPGKYTKTLNLDDLADHVLEDLDPDFRNRVKQGDIVAGGDNFGCGSSREQAPLALKTAGVSAVVAKSFARIFFRNAINIGLPVIELKDHNIETGHHIEVDLTEGIVSNLSTDEVHQGTQIPDVMVNILNEGGLVNYLKKYKTYRVN
ncbi:3-isopropylmalate dehydratase small subunit [Alkalihalobacillus sp. AL-G]|uniref:3-isopropylmalate dehydratase small subunit n=1 Tax=Alkalihalobacillus sp. AL-G TaxID=2926399 RepID=UPI002729F025|nr:3-isopropylmalate dehydratase small subunit [Alkalihalobacillus sp. AL-G]WLD93701.1 3-isopropylmalate dehydratase small subunit [Alkalihalobacillus sp. AL-G]